MRIVACADCHLGFGNFGGRFQEWRQKDFLNNFSILIESACSADLLIIAGDLFHSHKPSFEIVYFVLEKFLDLFMSNTNVLVIYGNHDRPKLEKIGVLAIFKQLPNVRIADTHSVVSFNNMEFECLPYGVEIGTPLRADFLVFHGAIGNLLPAERFRVPEEFLRNRICFGGHIHDCLRYKNCVFPGAIERLNFGEMASQCGFWVFEGGLEYFPLPAKQMRVVEKLPVTREKDVLYKVRECNDPELPENVMFEQSFGDKWLPTWDEFCKSKKVSPEVRKLGEEFLNAVL